MKLHCTKCNQPVIRTMSSIKESARLKGITPEEYVKNFVCRKCQSLSNEPKKLTSTISDDLPTVQERSQKLVMAKKCFLCANKCKVYTVSPKTILGCVRYIPRGKENEQSSSSQES